MARFARTPRTPRIPEDLRARLGGEAPLAWAPLHGGGAVSATTDALHFVRTADDTARHVPWELVDHAEWHPEGALDLRAVDGSTTRLVLDGEHPRLPVVVRERVQASVTHLVQRELPGGVTVRAAIRRSATGALTSQVTYTGVDHPTPAVRRVGEELEREARAAVGLPD